MQTAKGTATELPQFPLQRLPRITLQKFYILGMRGSAEVCFPPRWRLCRWTAVQQPHPTPTPPPSHSTIQLESTSMSLWRCDLDPPDSPWRFFLSHRWPMYCSLGKSCVPYPRRHISRLGCSLWFCEGKTYLRARQKLEQVTAVCRLIFLCGFKSETCCWKLPDRNK